MKLPAQRNTAVFILCSLLGIFAAAYAGAAVAVQLYALDGSFMKLMSSSTIELSPKIVISGIAENVPDTRKFAGYSAFIAAIVAASLYNGKRFHRKGSEHGSARWAKPAEKKILADKSKKCETITAKTWTNKKGKPVTFKTDNNVILANDVMMSLNTRQHMKNTHVLIVGGSGSGKTRFYCKPNVMQLNTSFVITDPKGEQLRASGKLLEEAGYEIKVFNIINMTNSFNYNPFEYIRDIHGNVETSKVIKMIDVFMRNTKGESENSSADPFWDNAAKELLTAIAFLLLEEGRRDEQNFAGVVKKMLMIEIKPREPDFKDGLDLEFEKVRDKNPRSQALKYYTAFKIAAPETAMSIIINCNVRFTGVYDTRSCGFNAH